MSIIKIRWLQLCIFFTAENPILITQHLYTCISNYFFFYGRPNILHTLGFTVPWGEAFLFKFNQELMQQWWTYIFSHIWTNILQSVSFHVISNGRFLVVQLGVSWAADVQETGSSLGWLHLCPKQYHPFILQTSRKRVLIWAGCTCVWSSFTLSYIAEGSSTWFFFPYESYCISF